MLTTVVGNYPKIPNRPHPARLRSAISKLSKGKISEDELYQVKNEVTEEVIGEQLDAGVDIITDGQIRWDDDQTYIAQKLKGIKIGGLQRYLDTNTYFREPEVNGALEWHSPILVNDYQFAAEHSNKPVKAVITGPYTLAALSIDNHYKDRGKLTLAYAEALNSEVKALQAAGARCIQVNDPLILQNKQDFSTFTDALKRMLNEVTIETALYTWFGSIDGIYQQLDELPVNIVGIDFMTKPENLELLKKTSFTKKLGCGIINGRNTKLESVDEIVSRVQEISDIVPPERLYLNPSCGLEFLPREVARAKLIRLVEGAQQSQATIGG